MDIEDLLFSGLRGTLVIISKQQIRSTCMNATNDDLDLQQFNHYYLHKARTDGCRRHLL